MRRHDRDAGASRAERGRPIGHPGFTLVEVIVAIALGGLDLIGAPSLLEGRADEQRHIARETAVADARANGYRALRSLVRDMEVGTTESGPFSGDHSRTSFTTWCDTAYGWQERCEITIAFESEGREPVLVAHLPEGRSLVLASGFRAGKLRYLNSASSGGQWFRQWGRGITAPLAIGVILERVTTSGESNGAIGDASIDTLIVRIGERG
jgi:prepilin-type N-terminal cleavage/methylation domain-containing protein